VTAVERLIAVDGPTATGKTTLAVRLAGEFGGEVVSADSRQVYRRMDIGTAKPTPAQRTAAPHHLIDIVDPDEDYSLALFQRQARSAIADIQSRSSLPVLVGGTGQYVWGLLEGWQVPEIPPDRSLRHSLEARARSEGWSALYADLLHRDPEAARRIDPRNTRRVIRALEIAQSLGSGVSDATRKQTPTWDIIVLGLTLERADLYRRIDARVDSMIAAGWVTEVEGLLSSGYDQGLPSMSSLGYGELCQYLKGKMTLDEAIARIKQRTRRFAKQQQTWFKPSDERVRWFSGSPEGLDAAVAFLRRLLERS